MQYCLKSLIFLAEPSLIIYYFIRICPIMHQKYTKLSLTLSLNITSPVNLIISAFNEMKNKQNKILESNSAPTYASLSLKNSCELFLI